MAKIFIVDDVASMRKMLKDILTKGGYQVIGEAGNGIEAVEQYRKLIPDLVTMDITMPVMEGLEALKHIIQQDPDAKVMMCSLMGQYSMVVQAIEEGAKDYIVKPFQADRVLATVKRVLG